VGRSAVCALKRLGAEVALFDIDQTKAEILMREYETVKEENLAEALPRYTILLDASPAAEIIQAEHIKPDTVIAACGIPLGLSNEAYSMVKERLVHDPLQIGVATMLAMAVKLR
jgi:pyrrolysine biosynthesis protein PylD